MFSCVSPLRLLVQESAIDLIGLCWQLLHMLRGLGFFCHVEGQWELQ
jgi:hypothetical protein